MAATVHSERTWKVEFLKYFQRFLGDTWFLCKCNEKDPIPERWRRFRDSAKVRFCCESCSNGWTSMKGRIVFWFYLDYRTRVGYCLFKLYGQKCKKCNKNMVFEPPMWYPEEINKVICNVYNRIGEVYYNFQKTTLLVDRRDGRPRLQHNRDLCQACQTGECWNGPGDIINAEGQHMSSRAALEGTSDDLSSPNSISEGTGSETSAAEKDNQSPESLNHEAIKSETDYEAESESSKTLRTPEAVRNPESDDSGVNSSHSESKPIVPKELTIPQSGFNYFAPPPHHPHPMMHNPNMGFLMSPPGGGLMFPPTPTQTMSSPNMLKNNPLIYNYPHVRGFPGSKPAGPPMDLSPTWTHFNLYHALNRMYIS